MDKFFSGTNRLQRNSIAAVRLGVHKMTVPFACIIYREFFRVKKKLKQQTASVFIYILKAAGFEVGA